MLQRMCFGGRTSRKYQYVSSVTSTMRPGTLIRWMRSAHSSAAGQGMVSTSWMRARNSPSVDMVSPLVTRCSSDCEGEYAGETEGANQRFFGFDGCSNWLTFSTRD